MTIPRMLVESSRTKVSALSKQIKNFDTHYMLWLNWASVEDHKNLVRLVDTS